LRRDAGHLVHDEDGWPMTEPVDRSPHTVVREARLYESLEAHAAVLATCPFSDSIARGPQVAMHRGSTWSGHGAKGEPCPPRRRNVSPRSSGRQAGGFLWPRRRSGSPPRSTLRSTWRNTSTGSTSSPRGLASGSTRIPRQRGSLDSIIICSASAAS